MDNFVVKDVSGGARRIIPLLSLLQDLACSLNLLHSHPPLGDCLCIKHARRRPLTRRFPSFVPSILNIGYVLAHLVLTLKLRPLDQGTRLPDKVLQRQIAFLHHVEIGLQLLFEFLQTFGPSDLELFGVSQLLLVSLEGLLESLRARVLVVENALLVKLLVHLTQPPLVDQVEVLPREINVVQLLLQRINGLLSLVQCLTLLWSIEDDFVLVTAEYVFVGSLGQSSARE